MKRALRLTLLQFRLPPPLLLGLLDGRRGSAEMPMLRRAPRAWPLSVQLRAPSTEPPLGRVAMREPAWPQRAAHELGVRDGSLYPGPYRRGSW